VKEYQYVLKFGLSPFICPLIGVPKCGVFKLLNILKVNSVRCAVDHLCRPCLPVCLMYTGLLWVHSKGKHCSVPHAALIYSKQLALVWRQELYSRPTWSRLLIELYTVRWSCKTYIDRPASPLIAHADMDSDMTAGQCTKISVTGWCPLVIGVLLFGTSIAVSYVSTW